MGNTAANRDSISSVGSFDEEEDKETFIERTKKQDDKASKAYLTLILANENKLYFTKEESDKQSWNCSDHEPGKIYSLEFLSIDKFDIIRKMWEEKPNYNDNKPLFEEKDDEMLIMYIRACRIINVNICGYEFAMDTLIGRHKLSVIRETMKKMQIYDKELSYKFCGRVVQKFVDEIKYVEDDKRCNEWIWASDYVNDKFLQEEEEYYAFYPALEFRASYIELDETQKLKAIQMLKIWIHQYSIGVFKFSSFLCGNRLNHYTAKDYSFSAWEIRELLSEDMPWLEVLELNYFTDDAIQIIGERISKLRISSLIIHISKEYEGKGFEDLCKGIGLNENLNAIVIYLPKIDNQCLVTQFAQGIIRNQTIKYIKLEDTSTFSKIKLNRNDFIQLFGAFFTLKSLSLKIDLQDSGAYFEKFLSENTSIRKLILCKYNEFEILLIRSLQTRR